MKIRSIALLLGALMLAAAPAQAQTAQRTYVATATGAGAQLLIGGQGLQVGFTDVAIRSGADQAPVCEDANLACAHAAAIAGGNDAKAAAPGGEATADETGGALPEGFSPILAGNIGKAVATAEVGRAVGEANGAHLELTLTQTITENAPQIQEGLKQISDGLLGPIAEGDPSGEVGPRLKQTVDSLIDNLSANPLLEVDILPSVSEVVAEANVVTARATAYGALIVVSPTELSAVTGPEGLIIIEVGQATAVAKSDGTHDGSAHVVRIKIFNPVTQTYDEIPVSAGEYRCGGEGTPLFTCVGLGAVEAKTEAGVTSVKAGGVSVNALDGQLKLELGALEVTSSAADVPPAPAPGPDLPLTGGGMALPALALLGLGTGATTLIRRRTL
jgi:hypothetical protein